MPKKPHSDTRLAKFLTKRILELRAKKSQIEIAFEAGFPNPSVLAMIKNGTTKLPLDRVPAMAQALECDAAYLIATPGNQSSHSTKSALLEMKSAGSGEAK